MWDTLWNCLRGLFETPVTAPVVALTTVQPTRKRLWILLKWDDYIASHTDFLITNGISIKEDDRGRREYLQTTGVGAKEWTYSADVPAREIPEGWRWICLESGYTVRIQL